MSSDPPPPPRAVVDLAGGQMADVKIGQAGASITNEGANADKVLDFLRTYVFQADQARETAIKDVRASIVILSDSLRAMREQLNDLAKDYDRGKEGEAQRLVAELRIRAYRQRVLNVWLFLITAAVVLMAVGWLVLLWRLWPTLSAAAAMAWGNQ